MAHDRFLQHFRELLGDSEEDSARMLTLLISVTVNYRDRLKEETGQVLTVEDTRRALDALEAQLRGEPPHELSKEQRTLLELWLKELESQDRR